MLYWFSRNVNTIWASISIWIDGGKLFSDCFCFSFFRDYSNGIIINSPSDSNRCWHQFDHNAQSDMADACLCLCADTHISKFIRIRFHWATSAGPGPPLTVERSTNRFCFEHLYVCVFHLINTETPYALLSFNEKTKLLAVIRVRAPIIASLSRMLNKFLIVTLMIVLLALVSSFSWLANEKSNRLMFCELYCC